MKNSTKDQINDSKNRVKSFESNVIYYKNGTKVCHGDDINLIDTDIQSYFGRKIVNIMLGIQHGCHYMNLELYCKYKENEYYTIYLTSELIKWDKNRMINVEKMDK